MFVQSYKQSKLKADHGSQDKRCAPQTRPITRRIGSLVISKVICFANPAQGMVGEQGSINGQCCFSYM
jgi:hypothetical protein